MRAYCKKIVIASIAIFVTFLPGCRESGELEQGARVEITTFSLNISSAGTFRFSDFLEEPEFIPLETTEESVISAMVKQSVVTDSIIFILPAVPNNSVYKFSTGGKFLGSFCKAGRGPLEYVSLEHIHVNMETRTIAATDIMNKSIITMYFDGTIKERFRLRDPSFGAWEIFAHPTEDYYLVNTSEGEVWETIGDEKMTRSYNLLYYDPVSGKTTCLLPAPFSFAISGLKSFSYYDNEVYFKPPRFDTVYIVRRDSVFPKFVFDFGNIKTRSELLKSGFSSDYVEYKKTPGVIDLHMHFFQTPVYVFSTHEVTPYTNIFHVYDKRTSVSKVYNKVVNDYLGCPYEQEFINAFLPDSFSDRYFLYLYSPATLFRFYNKLKETLSEEEFMDYLDKNKGYAGLMSNLKETDNHVLVKYKIRGTHLEE